MIAPAWTCTCTPRRVGPPCGGVRDELLSKCVCDHEPSCCRAWGMQLERTLTRLPKRLAGGRRR